MTLFVRHIRRVSGLFFFVTIALVTCAASSRAESTGAQKQLTKAVAVIHCNYPPVSFRDKHTNAPSGFFVDIMDSVAERAGLQVNYVCKDGWAEMIHTIESGEADLGVLLKSSQREKKLLFSTPIDTTYFSFFARSQSRVDAEKAPEGYAVGVVRGSMSCEQLKRRPDVNLRTYGSYQEGVFGLLAGEIGLFAGEESMILKCVRETRLEDRIKKVGKPFLERERGLAVKKDNVQLLRLLNKALCGFTGSPEYQRIYLTWYGAPAPHWTNRRIFAASGLFLFIVVCGMALWRYVSIARINRELVRNITERRHAEESLLLFSNLLNRSNDAIFVNDPATGRFLIVNDKACSNLGYSSTELLAMRTIDIESSFPDQSAWDTHVHELKSRGYMILEGLHKRNDGTAFPVEANVTYMTLGEKDYMVAVVRDITERKLTEQALRTSEERLSKAQEMAHVGNWEWNIVTNELYWSKEVYRIYGLDPGHFVPTFDTVRKAMHPDDLEPFLKAVDAAIYDRKPFEMDYRLIRPDGTIRTVHTIGDVSYDRAGNALIKSGTVQDITEMKRAAEKLKTSEEFVGNILDTIDEGFIVIDRNYHILTANRAYCKQADARCDGIIGKHCYEVSHRAQQPCYEAGEECAVRKVFETGVPSAAYHQHIDAEGNILYVETRAFPLKDASGSVTSVIESISNMTEKHLLQEERLKTQKLEAIGMLAGGIAHDFNNLLQGVFGYISLAKLTANDREKSIAALEQAEKALHMTVKLTNQLLTFSKGGKPMKKRIDLRAVIENATKFAMSGSRAEYRLDIAARLRAVEADEGQIGQVIQNIVLNADQAMPTSGTVSITARNVDAPEAGVPIQLKPGVYAEVSISDSGLGIPEQYLPMIFDPYFTTKEKGSGLGLATSYSIIRNHGGLIDVKSETGKGSTFLVYLPAVVSGQEAMSLRQPAGSRPPVRTGKVLLMDDERVILDVAGQLIRALGHEVEFAVHGADAIEKYESAEQTGKPFTVLILDLTIRGGMGGIETLKKIREKHPGAKAIVSSGYSENAALSDYARHGFIGVLKKPYTVGGLQAALDEALKRERPPAT
ncbi:MAG: PAS domain S-box protein, partial [Nitrospirae bacterium]|nr:PAS domain S-box protein [Nitrospirota bacterium]